MAQFLKTMLAESLPLCHISLTLPLDVTWGGDINFVPFVVRFLHHNSVWESGENNIHLQYAGSSGVRALFVPFKTVQRFVLSAVEIPFDPFWVTPVQTNLHPKLDIDDRPHLHIVKYTHPLYVILLLILCPCPLVLALNAQSPAHLSCVQPSCSGPAPGRVGPGQAWEIVGSMLRWVQTPAGTPIWQASDQPRGGRLMGPSKNKHSAYTHAHSCVWSCLMKRKWAETWQSVCVFNLQ